MAVYLDNRMAKININGVVYKLNLFSTTPIFNGTLLLSYENYLLKDSNGVYLTAKEENTYV